MTLLLYALVTPSGEKPRLRGMRGEALRVVSVAGVGALVGAVSSSPQPKVRNLRAYHDVMLAVSPRFTALVPARFGTAVTDDEELAFILRMRAPSFRRLLAAVRGRVQMTARFVDASGREDDDERPADRSSGTAYLRSRATSQARLAESDACVQLRGRAKRWIRGERVERRNRVTTMYHLVPRGAAERYRRAIEDVALPDGQRVHVSGPFPPFAFADPLQLEAVAGRASGAPISARRRG